MLATLLYWIGYILLGGAILIGAVLGAAYYVAKEINAGHGKGCSCPKCQARRQRQWQRAHPDPEATQPLPKVNPARDPGKWVGDKKPYPDWSTWVSTLELHPGMTVLGKESGSIFHVERVVPTSFGFMVVLTNQMTNKVSRIPVQARRAQNRIWLIRRKGGQ